MRMAMLFLSLPAGAFALGAAHVAGNPADCFSGTLENRERFLAAAHAGVLRAATAEELARFGEWYDLARAQFDASGDGYVCRLFEYPVDGLVVQGFYVRPRVVEKPLPVIVYNRGGNATSGPRLLTPAGFGKIFRLAQRGYLVVGSLYRGARLDGAAHPDAGLDEFGGRDVNDVLALLDIVDAMPDADPERIGIWGFNRGGMMAFLAARRSPRFAALVAESSPMDLADELAFRPEMEQVMETWIPAYRENRASVLRERSPLAWVDELPADLPILILQGTADWRVRPSGALDMAARLQELDRDYRLVMFDGGDHGGQAHYEEIVGQVAAWFDRHLGRGEIAQE